MKKSFIALGVIISFFWEFQQVMVILRKDQAHLRYSRGTPKQTNTAEGAVAMIRRLWRGAAFVKRYRKFLHLEIGAVEKTSKPISTMPGISAVKHQSNRLYRTEFPI